MRFVSIVLLALLALSSCHLFHKSIPDQWEESELRIINQKVLFEGVVFALEKEGFRVGTGANPGDGTIESAWRVSASPFKGKGYRERAILTFGPGH
ncbi:MAG TPA: hypothetical protein PLJ12_13915, partial [Planctomycetota bacterium]|nr:hypothetical protein [Planctomycetota bacterium]